MVREGVICREEGRDRVLPAPHSRALQGVGPGTQEVCSHTGRPQQGPWLQGTAPPPGLQRGGGSHPDTRLSTILEASPS